MDKNVMEALRELAKNGPMKCEIVGDQQQFDAAIERHAKEGRRLAAVSNAGLSFSNQRRLTFLPESAFLKPGEKHKQPGEPQSVDAWLAELKVSG